MSAPERIAPEGKIWVCLACGKTARDRYGADSRGWDASCVINAQMFDESRLVKSGTGYVIEVRPTP